MRRAVLMICDGLRHDLVTPENCPSISALGGAARRFLEHRAIFPSVTRASAASIATGCRPGRHGLHGNTMALDEGAGLAVQDAGKPDFRTRMRRATGRTLRVPTLAERLAEHGGVIVYSNVSPGAAYFHDPDGFGHVHHRAGSFGPGGAPLEPLEVSHDAAGDRAMTERFCREVLMERRPALGVLWLCEPDRTAHHFGIGSPEHRAAMTAADRCAGLVGEAVQQLRDQGEDVLFLLGADHGQETICETIPLESRLIAAGLKDSADSSDVVVAAQGSAGLVYLSDRGMTRREAIATWLRAQPWLARLFVGEDLCQVHLVPDGGLAMALGLAKSDTENRFGVPGLTYELGGSAGVREKAGLATHGGQGRYEIHPFLLAIGGGFVAGSTSAGPTSVIDLAPTILRHLGRPADALDGAPLPTS